MRSLMTKKIVICDGALGTMIQSQGIEMGHIPELLNFTNPEVLKNIYRSYYEAGSDFVSTNTFGANRIKLKDSGYTVEQVITQGVNIAKEVAEEFNKGAKSKKFVALDISTIGKLMEPTGDLTFENAYDIFKEQIVAGDEAGADLILLETFTDIYELKAAIIAAKENSDLPVFCSVTFQDNGRTLMGSDPITVVNTLQDLNIDAIGVNCSLGPKDIIPLVKEFLKYSKIPVMVQPNAGLPKVEDGKTVYDVNIDEFTDAMLELIEAGVSIAGGCCGTNPDYIKELSKGISRKTLMGDIKAEQEHRQSAMNDNHDFPITFTAVSSATKTVMMDGRVRIVGERINPTGKKLLKEALANDDMEYVESEALNQIDAGAAILDINVGLPGIDEKAAMVKVIKRISALTNTPLQIDSANPEVIEAAARIYNGKPLINSVNGKQESMDAIFPIVKKYGACVIALTLDEKGLPESTEERIQIAKRIVEEAEKYDISKERIIVDCLTLTISAQQNAGKDTLNAIRQIKEMGLKTTLGASNISFGLPERKLLNSTFLAMALEAGLDMPITDPTVKEYRDTIAAFEALAFKDIESKEYIEKFGGQDVVKEPKKEVKSENKSDKSLLEEIILKGYEEKAPKITEELLKSMKPLEIVEQVIIPALEKVGKEYEVGNTYLPQLIKSADTVSSAFTIIKPAMETAGEKMNYGKIILATVEGDIHDIGKNIVKILLENYGYEVIDLGKDVPIGRVVEEAIEHDIKLVGLSALMTTTVVNMEKTIKALKEKNISCMIAVGGAVLTEEYSAKIGADYYCKDAMDTVRAANAVFKK